MWTFLAAPAPVPETLIAASPATLVEHMLDAWADADVFPPDVRAAYTRQFADPDHVHAICEQYRAAATLDHQHDLADHGRVKIRCPVLALWGAGGAVDEWYDPLAVWREWADEVRGNAVAAGHFLPEEAPTEIIQELQGFFG